ncbi:MAG: hypothetical protein ACRD63_02810 [Pyrinomonadaceae bacterium]
MNISTQLFQLDENIRYVAVNQRGKIVEMQQNPKLPTGNSHDTDRIEELIVNPTLLGLAKRRGELDLDGIRYLIIRYGILNQLVFPYKQGHISVGIELNANVAEIARKIAQSLSLPL